jgi:hypothetical protein
MIGLGKGPKGPKLLATREAVKPWDTTDMSVRKRIKTEDVEDVIVMGTSEPSGGKLQNKLDDAAQHKP